MKEFSEFDFTDIVESVNQYNEFFFVDYLDNEIVREAMIKLSKEVPSNANKRQIGQLFIDKLKEMLLKGKRLEYYHQMYSRVQRFKLQVKKFVKENNVKDGELIIVSHSNFSKSWTAKHFDFQNDMFLDFYYPKNCEMFEVSI